MIQKLKLIILSFSTLITMSLAVPMLVAGNASAATVTQDSINANLCSGSNGDFTTTGGSNEQCTADTATSRVNSLITTVINIISVLVGVIAVIMIIVGGFRYVTSGGKDESVKGAKNTILYALIGLVIVALAQIIVHFVLNKTTTATTAS